MRPLLVISLLASVPLLSACVGTYADRGQLSAKGWDTPFVYVKPIRESDPNATGVSHPQGRMALSQAAYGQFPVSIDPSLIAAEMEAAPGMPTDAAVAAEATAAPASAPASAPESHAEARAAVHPVIEAGSLVVKASAARSHAETALEAWYESRHVDLMPRSEWVR